MGIFDNHLVRWGAALSTLVGIGALVQSDILKTRGQSTEEPLPTTETVSFSNQGGDRYQVTFDCRGPVCQAPGNVTKVVRYPFGSNATYDPNVQFIDNPTTECPDGKKCYPLSPTMQQATWKATSSIASLDDLFDRAE